MYKAWIKGSGAGYPWCLKEGGAYVRTESTDHWRTSEKMKTDHRTEKDPFRMSYWKETGPVVRRFTTWLLKRIPTIGLATVYRMVGVLEEMGFLSRGYRYSYPVEDKIS